MSSEGDFAHPQCELCSGSAASPRVTEGANGKHNHCNPDIRTVFVLLFYFSSCVFCLMFVVLVFVLLFFFFVKLKPVIWLRGYV